MSWTWSAEFAEFVSIVIELVIGILPIQPHTNSQTHGTLDQIRREVIATCAVDLTSCQIWSHSNNMVQVHVCFVLFMSSNEMSFAKAYYQSFYLRTTEF